MSLLLDNGLRAPQVQCLPAQMESLAIFVSEVLPHSASDLNILHLTSLAIFFQQKASENCLESTHIASPIRMNCILY